MLRLLVGHNLFKIGQLFIPTSCGTGQSTQVLHYCSIVLHVKSRLHSSTSWQGSGALASQCRRSTAGSPALTFVNLSINRLHFFMSCLVMDLLLLPHQISTFFTKFSISKFYFLQHNHSCLCKRLFP